MGFDAWIFIPADLEPAKVLGTQVFGAKLIRIAGNYDQVNRLCSQIGEQLSLGLREHQPAALLCRRLEDRRLRNRRAAWLAPAG